MASYDKPIHGQVDRHQEESRRQETAGMKWWSKSKIGVEAKITI